MPLYDFQCEFCANVEEHLTRTDDTDPNCSICNGKMYRLISVPANFTGERIKTVNAKLDRIGAKEYKD